MTGHSWRSVVEGRLSAVRVQAAASDRPPPPPRWVLPGSFNPLHHGHLRMAACVAARYGEPVDFELSIDNVDKPELPEAEVAYRLSQFAPHQAVWVSRAATFREKSALFPGAGLLIGVDTLQRIADPRYYRQAEQGIAETVEALRQHGCRLVVFGRRLAAGFCELEQVAVPAELRERCLGVPSAEFRDDISSTQLRREDSESD